METTELHEVVQYRGRDVCSCGDLNCASLDVRPRPKPFIFQDPTRHAVYMAYPHSDNWLARVRTMNDNQIFAIHNRLRAANKI